MLKEKKIPTIIGLFLLLIGLTIGVFLVRQGQVFFLRAAPEITPSQVKITNIVDSSFSVSWITTKATSGFIRFGETPSLTLTAADDRDQISGETESFQAHHVTLRNLKPKTRYFFKLGSGGKLFDNSGNPYEITTAPSLTGETPPSDITSGKIIKADGSPAEDTIVYFSLANVTPQSALVRSSGNWLIPLNTARSADLSSFASYDKEAQVEEIFVQGGSLGTATAIITTKNDNPVPDIVLGKTYDFRQILPPETVVSPTPIPIGEEAQITPPTSKFSFEEMAPPTEATETAELTITNPAEEGENISTQKPEFAGTGPVGKTIQILVESPAYSGTVVVESDGSWTWTPPANLPPGEHKITITYLGQTISRTFTVLAAGAEEFPAFTATPSATITPSPTPTTTPTPTATPSARTAMPATEEGVPEPGYLTPTFLVFIMGLGLILSGFVVKRFTAHAR